MTEILYALNDFDYSVLLEDINQLTSHREPVTTGLVKAWLVAAASEDAAALVELVDAVVPATCAHVGVDPIIDPEDKPLGTWLIHIDRDTLDRTTLDAAYPSSSTTIKPYLVLDDPAGARVILPLAYKRSRKAVVAAAA